jgi:hypothetical protein
MASIPDVHPDNVPAGPSESPEQITPPSDPGRESIEDMPDEPAGPA